MLCPLCKNELVSDPDEPFFTFEDAALSQIHSTKHICINKYCELKQHKSFWNDYGEFFSGDLSFSKSRKLFPDNNYAAYNTISKRHEVEIYKNGLKKSLSLSPWLTLGWLKPEIEYIYKGDEMGNVLKKSYKLKFLYRGHDKKMGYTTYYTSGVSMLYRKIKRTLKDIKNYKKNKNDFSKFSYSLLQVYKWYDFRNSNLKWYEKFYKFFIRTFYKKTLKLSENYTSFIDYVNRHKEIDEKTYFDFETELIGIDILPILLKNNFEGEIITQKLREIKLKRIMKNRK